jgi:hypothetical protein
MDRGISTQKFDFDDGNNGYWIEEETLVTFVNMPVSVTLLHNGDRSVFVENEDMILRIASSLTPAIELPLITLYLGAETEETEQWTTATAPFQIAEGFASSILSISFPSSFEYFVLSSWPSIQVNNNDFDLNIGWGGFRDEWMFDGITAQHPFTFNDGRTGFILEYENQIRVVSEYASLSLWLSSDLSTFTNNESIILEIARTLSYDFIVPSTSTLVGRWQLDYFDDQFRGAGETDPIWGLFAGGEILEFFADGTGVERWGEHEWFFSWSISPDPPMYGIITVNYTDLELQSSFVNYGNEMFIGWIFDGPASYMRFIRI